MRWYEVTKVTKKGKTGKTIGTLRAKNLKSAMKFAFKTKAKGAGRIRIFPVKLVDKKKRR